MATKVYLSIAFIGNSLLVNNLLESFISSNQRDFSNRINNFLLSFKQGPKPYETYKAINILKEMMIVMFLSNDILKASLNNSHFPEINFCFSVTFE